MTFLAHPMPPVRLETVQEAKVTCPGAFIVISDALPSEIEQPCSRAFATNA